MTVWILVTHIYQCRTEVGSCSHGITVCSTGSVATAAIPKSKLPYYTNQPRGLDIVALVRQNLRNVGEMAISTSQVKIQCSPPRRHQASGTGRTFKA